MRKLAHWFAVELPPADQAHYRETAFSDTRAILRHPTIVAVVAALTLAASIIAAVGSHFSVFEKIVLAGLGTYPSIQVARGCRVRPGQPKTIRR